MPTLKRPQDLYPFRSFMIQAKRRIERSALHFLEFVCVFKGELNMRGGSLASIDPTSRRLEALEASVDSVHRHEIVREVRVNTNHKDPRDLLPSETSATRRAGPVAAKRCGWGRRSIDANVELD
jgi:hypothetical protein